MPSSSSSQLVLDLSTPPRVSRQDFIVSDSNADALAWIDRWPEWPGAARALAVHGPPSSGKSHLAAVWRGETGAVTVQGPALEEASIEALANGDGPLLVEASDRVAEGRLLLHLHNMIADRVAAGDKTAGMLLVSRVPVAQLDLGPPDLRSRLRAMPAVALGRPDDALLAAVTRKLFADRQIAVSKSVVDYLVRRIDRSFETVHRVVEALDRAALADRSALTVPFVRGRLDDILSARAPDVDGQPSD